MSSKLLKEYFQLLDEFNTLKSKEKELSTKLKTLESEIKIFMETQNKNIIKYDDKEIHLIDKKIPQNLNKEIIKLQLTEKIKDEKKCEELAENIIKHKKVNIVKKLQIK